MLREDKQKNVSTAASEKKKKKKATTNVITIRKKRCFCQIRNQEHIPH